MTWWSWYCVLMRYYNGLSYTDINEMTIWQFVGAIKNMGCFESLVNKSSANPGESPSIQQIRARAKALAKQSEINARNEWEVRKKQNAKAGGNIR